MEENGLNFDSLQKCLLYAFNYKGLFNIIIPENTITHYPKVLYKYILGAYLIVRCGQSFGDVKELLESLRLHILFIHNNMDKLHSLSPKELDVLMEEYYERYIFPKTAGGAYPTVLKEIVGEDKFHQLKTVLEIDTLDKVFFVSEEMDMWVYCPKYIDNIYDINNEIVKFTNKLLSIADNRYGDFICTDIILDPTSPHAVYYNVLEGSIHAEHVMTHMPLDELRLKDSANNIYECVAGLFDENHYVNIGHYGVSRTLSISLPMIFHFQRICNTSRGTRRDNLLLIRKQMENPPHTYLIEKYTNSIKKIDTVLYLRELTEEERYDVAQAFYLANSRYMKPYDFIDNLFLMPSGYFYGIEITLNHEHLRKGLFYRNTVIYYKCNDTDKTRRLCELMNMDNRLKDL